MHRPAFFMLAAICAVAQPKFDVEAMLRIPRVSDPAVSPDGKLVAFTVQTPDVQQNTKPEQIWIVPVQGGPPIQITHEGSVNERPRWMPDSQHLVYTSDRGGSSQIWMIDAHGGGARQLTTFATEVSGELVSADGKTLLFVSTVYPECGADDACNASHVAQEKATRVQARIYTSLLYRHWTDWQSRRRSHLFAMPMDGGSIVDLTPGTRDVPPFSLGGPDDYAISPDSKEVCFAMNADPVPAVSTNTDLFVVPITGGAAKRITENPGADASPLYSPDGHWLAYRRQARAGYESDRWVLLSLDRASGKALELTANLDRSVDEFQWSPDSSRLFFTSLDRGRRAIQMMPATGGATRIIASGNNSLEDIHFTPDAATMIYTAQSGAAPPEIFRASNGGGAPVALTHFSDPILAEFQLNPYEEFWVEGAEHARIHCFLLKPPGFNPNRKYPVLLLIHGGPQGEWGEEWSYRWNAEVFASAGYVVIMPNQHGSFGYGQKFTEEVSGDWGGQPFEDVMAAAEYASKLPYTDGERMSAAGASYGGYMIDWMLGHTDRFRSFVSHCGVYDLRSEAGATEELWFPLWEFQGMPWDNPEQYEKWSPSNFVKNFKTPTLVITGEKDFRIPYTQSLQLFTALQLQKVDSKLLIFPDEGHWVLKPANSVLWYHTVLDWIDQHTKTVAPRSKSSG
ncbi:MAG TPA: S9 family peptidase [Bryobacteraceae bacterium]|nr:S9 family peptidase [Bryobacteraceae bacterium]